MCIKVDAHMSWSWIDARRCSYQIADPLDGRLTHRPMYASNNTSRKRVTIADDPKTISPAGAVLCKRLTHIPVRWRYI